MNPWIWRWGPAVAQMGVIFTASSLTHVPDLPAGLSNHTGHFIGYALLGALLVRALARARWDGVTSRAAITAVIMASVYGVSDEVHQMFVSNRTPSVSDWTADTIGAATGVLIVMWFARNRRDKRVSDV